jgi:hypothetical protein
VPQENIKNDLDSLQRLAKRIKILEIEKNMAAGRGFWKGLLVGVAAVMLLMGVAGFLIWQNQAATLEFVADHFLMGYLENLFAGFPEAYMTNNRERVIQTLDTFTNAMQNQQVSKDDFREIARQIFAALKDQRLTYQELDGLLAHLQKAAQPVE